MASRWRPRRPAAKKNRGPRASSTCSARRGNSAGTSGALVGAGAEASLSHASRAEREKRLRQAIHALRVEHDVVVVQIERLVGMPVVEAEAEQLEAADQARTGA